MDKRIVVLMTLFFLIFTVFVSFVLLGGPLSKFTKASGKYIVVSPVESKIIFWPQTVKADGVSASTIQVFLVSENKTPITNKKVKLRTDLGSTKEPELTTAEDGSTYYQFHLVSDQEGLSNVEVLVDDTLTLNQKFSVKFIK